jgi:hypothetical protein
MPSPADSTTQTRNPQEPFADGSIAPAELPGINDRRTEWLASRHLQCFAAAVWAVSLIGLAVLVGPRAGGLGLGLSCMWFGIVSVLAWRPPGIPKFQFHFHHDDPVRVERTDPLNKLPVRQRIGAATLAAATVSLMLLVALQLLGR